MKTIKGIEALLTMDDLTVLLGVSKPYISALREYGLLRMEKRGRRYTATPEAYKAFLELTAGADLAGRGDIITFARTHKLKKFN